MGSEQKTKLVAKIENIKIMYLSALEKSKGNPIIF
tara:strand:- start:77 stop:181 length:105 start_codon:yes stop_codon:yes gene_type:complete